MIRLAGDVLLVEGWLRVVLVLSTVLRMSYNYIKINYCFGNFSLKISFKTEENKHFVSRILQNKVNYKNMLCIYIYIWFYNVFVGQIIFLISFSVQLSLVLSVLLSLCWRHKDLTKSHKGSRSGDLYFSVTFSFVCKFLSNNPCRNRCDHHK